MAEALERLAQAKAINAGTQSSGHSDTKLTNDKTRRETSLDINEQISLAAELGQGESAEREEEKAGAENGRGESVSPTPPERIHCNDLKPLLISRQEDRFTGSESREREKLRTDEGTFSDDDPVTPSHEKERDNQPKQEHLTTSKEGQRLPGSTWEKPSEGIIQERDSGGPDRDGFSRGATQEQVPMVRVEGQYLNVPPPQTSLEEPGKEQLVGEADQLWKGSTKEPVVGSLTEKLLAADASGVSAVKSHREDLKRAHLGRKGREDRLKRSVQKGNRERGVLLAERRGGSTSQVAEIDAECSAIRKQPEECVQETKMVFVASDPSVETDGGEATDPAEVVLTRDPKQTANQDATAKVEEGSADRVGGVGGDAVKKELLHFAVHSLSQKDQGGAKEPVTEPSSLDRPLEELGKPQEEAMNLAKGEKELQNLGARGVKVGRDSAEGSELEAEKENVPSRDENDGGNHGKEEGRLSPKKGTTQQKKAPLTLPTDTLVGILLASEAGNQNLVSGGIAAHKGCYKNGPFLAKGLERRALAAVKKGAGQRDEILAARRKQVVAPPVPESPDDGVCILRGV